MNINFLNKLQNIIVNYVDSSHFFNINNEIKELINLYEIHQIPKTENINILLNNYLLFLKTIGRLDSTITYYKRIISKYLNTIEKLDVSSFDIINYLKNYKSTYKISNLTLDNIRRVLSSFYLWLFNQNIIINNPFKSINKIKYSSKPKSIFTIIDLKTILSKTSSQRDKLILLILITTGIRVNELINIKIYDIDLNKSTILIKGKGNVYRYATIMPILIPILTNYISYNKSIYLITNKYNNKLTTEGIRYILHNISIKTNIKDITPHKIRRSIANILLSKNINIEYIRQFLGHKHINTTQIYLSTIHNNLINTTLNNTLNDIICNTI